MSQPLRKIVSVNTADRGGGAEHAAWTLFKGFERQGLESWLVVGDKKTDDPNVLPFFLSPHVDYRPYADAVFQAELEAARRRELAAGIEDFNFPYSKYLPTITGSEPDAIVCHNLHGGFFDLRVLPELSQRIPIFLVLHDHWTFTGHCGCPLECSRWQTGCGGCPDLTLPPAIQRDATDLNWRTKREILARCRLYVTSPTQWLLDRARQSILAPAMLESRVIPCPIDVTRFHPADRAQVRRELGLPLDAHVLVFAAHKARTNPYKDSATVEASVQRLAQLMPDDEILFLGLGEEAPEIRVGNTRLRFLPFQPPELAARYLQAADVYLHAARQENFGLVTAEAQACGTPVVATAVGGLPEVIADGQRGWLVPPGDAEQMATATAHLLQNPPVQMRFGDQAARHARQHWAEQRVVNQFLSWIAEVRQTARIAA
jgi:glycosyltransferase involved in cell wall biosynthesis